MSLNNVYQKAEETAAYLTVLANAKRIEIVCLLEDSEFSVGALADKVHLSQSALSQHLAKLRSQGLVATRRDGQTIYYRLACPLATRLLTMMQDDEQQLTH
ncbi:transcriptional regulator [Zhengella mangrovi]|uniref:Transcriptional regulator n=1 Tax=Zhengella mangrovi TaxID=1982044 RepID=A0A2G1QP87_9HYPH|nr:metalloregulator ArsR/SmtB family transcription factor [Zhengella mangrovi]PHP67305.1 transcriptional regulator [Zhengella mangrovi]